MPAFAVQRVGKLARANRSRPGSSGTSPRYLQHVKSYIPRSKLCFVASVAASTWSGALFRFADYASGLTQLCERIAVLLNTDHVPIR